MRKIMMVLAALSFACPNGEIPPVNKEMWLECSIKNAVDVYAVGTTVLYDKSFVAILSDSGGKPITDAGNVIPNADVRSFPRDGMLVVSCSSLGTEGVSGSGRLWRTKIKALRKGTSSLNFDWDSAAMAPEISPDGTLMQLSTNFVGVRLSVMNDGSVSLFPEMTSGSIVRDSVATVELSISSIESP